MIAEKTLAISEENVSMVSILLLAGVIEDLKETDAKLVRFYYQPSKTITT